MELPARCGSVLVNQCREWVEIHARVSKQDLWAECTGKAPEAGCIREGFLEEVTPKKNLEGTGRVGKSRRLGFQAERTAGGVLGWMQGMKWSLTRRALCLCWYSSYSTGTIYPQCILPEVYDDETSPPWRRLPCLSGISLSEHTEVYVKTPGIQEVRVTRTRVIANEICGVQKKH